jgi:hypothetical protein
MEIHVKDGDDDDVDDDSDTSSYGSSWGDGGVEEWNESRRSSGSIQFTKSRPEKYPQHHSPPQSGISLLRQRPSTSTRNRQVSDSSGCHACHETRELDQDGLKPRSTTSRQPSRSPNNTRQDKTTPQRAPGTFEGPKNVHKSGRCVCDRCQVAGTDYNISHHRTSATWDRQSRWHPDLRLKIPADPRTNDFDRYY